MYSRELKQARASLVERAQPTYGSFLNAFERVNILDLDRPYYFPLPRVIRYFRINEAHTFQIDNPEIFAYFDFYNAKLFTLVLISVYDKVEGRRHGYWRFRVGSHLRFGDRGFCSDLSYRDGPFKVRIESPSGSGRIRLKGRVRRYRDRPNLEFVLDYPLLEQAQILNSVIPLGLNRPLYSARLYSQPKGYISLGTRRFGFHETGSLGFFTDHKGFLPYIVTVDWVVGMGLDAQGRRMAFNLADNHIPNQDRYNENALWLDGKINPLPNIRITRPEGPGGAWVIQDTEGMVDLHFFPRAKNSVHVNVIFAESDYHGPFGEFKGWIMDGGGSKLRVDGFFGMGKMKRVRA